MQKKESVTWRIGIRNYPKEQKEKRVKKSKERLWELWVTMQRNKIHIMGIPEGKEKEKGTGSIFKTIMAENFPNLEREMDIQIHKTQKITNRLNPNKTTLRHIIIKLSKVKDKIRILGAAREKREIT